MKFVEPKTYLVGYTTIDQQGITQYLIDSGQEEFLELMSDAIKELKLGTWEIKFVNNKI